MENHLPGTGTTIRYRHPERIDDQFLAHMISDGPAHYLT